MLQQRRQQRQPNSGTLQPRCVRRRQGATGATLHRQVRGSLALLCCMHLATLLPGLGVRFAVSLGAPTRTWTLCSCPFLPAANQAAGTRTLAASASKLARDRGGTGPPAAAGVSGWKRRQDLLRGINSGDAVLLLGGDLNVTVVQAQVGQGRLRGISSLCARVGCSPSQACMLVFHLMPLALPSVPIPLPALLCRACTAAPKAPTPLLASTSRSPSPPQPVRTPPHRPAPCALHLAASSAPRPAPPCHVYGRSGAELLTQACPRDVPPPPPPLSTPAEERAKQTTVVWQSCDPVWDEQLLFRDVCAASELGVELWDLGGTRSAAQLHRLAQNPSGRWHRVGRRGRRLARADGAAAVRESRADLFEQVCPAPSRACYVCPSTAPAPPPPTQR